MEANDSKQLLRRNDALIVIVRGGHALTKGTGSGMSRFRLLFAEASFPMRQIYIWALAKTAIPCIVSCTAGQPVVPGRRGLAIRRYPD